ncbi:MAG: L-threonylcarbamoyladenylate synthase [Acidobacteria bacterium]|nr:L-threonylcarbamoyladenylate synthase [Acidobacteriota bacterium]
MVSREQIAEAAALIRSGRVVAFPTETVYGLGANALDPSAINRIYAIKERPKTSPLIVHVSSVNMAKGLVAHWPGTADILANAFWPGPLTLVLPRGDKIPLELTAGLDTVGLRMPAHPVALALIEESGLPIAAPSANRFTQLSPTTAQHVADGLGEAVDMILDGGPTEVGIESTVLSLTGPQPVLLRPGMVTREQIEAHLGPILLLENAGAAHASPGLHAKHYSPRTPLYLLSPAEPLPKDGDGVYLHWSTPRDGATSHPMPQDPAQYAAILYDTLHQVDLHGYDWIAVEAPPAGSAWAGILDRLKRASIR